MEGDQIDHQSIADLDPDFLTTELFPRLSFSSLFFLSYVSKRLMNITRHYIKEHFTGKEKEFLSLEGLELFLLDLAKGGSYRYIVECTSLFGTRLLTISQSTYDALIEELLKAKEWTLFEEFVKALGIPWYDEDPILRGASSSGDLHFLQSVLDKISTIISRRNYRALFDGAMSGGHVGILEYLVDVAKEQNIKIDDIATPKFAAANGHLQALEFFVQKFANSGYFKGMLLSAQIDALSSPRSLDIVKFLYAIVGSFHDQFYYHIGAKGDLDVYLWARTNEDDNTAFGTMIEEALRHKHVDFVESIRSIVGESRFTPELRAAMRNAAMDSMDLETIRRYVFDTFPFGAPAQEEMLPFIRLFNGSKEHREIFELLVKRHPTYKTQEYELFKYWVYQVGWRGRFLKDESINDEFLSFFTSIGMDLTFFSPKVPGWLRKYGLKALEYYYIHNSKDFGGLKRIPPSLFVELGKAREFEYLYDRKCMSQGFRIRSLLPKTPLSQVAFIDLIHRKDPEAFSTITNLIPFLNPYHTSVTITSSEFLRGAQYLVDHGVKLTADLFAFGIDHKLELPYFRFLVSNNCPRPSGLLGRIRRSEMSDVDIQRLVHFLEHSSKPSSSNTI